MSLCDRNIDRYVRNKYYAELDSLTPVMRFARKYELLLDELTLEVRADDEIFGWFVFRGEKCEELKFTDETVSEEVQRLIEKCHTFGSRTVVDRGHTLVDYESVLKNGLSGYEGRIDRELRGAPDSEYLLGMKATLEAIKSFVSRLVSTLDEKFAVGESDEQKQKLLEIKESLMTVPFAPAKSFRDAVQCIWLIHFLVPLAEDSWASISLGRLDQYLYPYYKYSVDRGMTRDEAKRILHHFYKLLNSYADGACLVNLGSDYNELSELIIECQKAFALPGPILAPRITDDTPEHIWDTLIDTELFSRGQPTFYGEHSCTDALIEKGITPDKAKKFSNNSCMGISFAGEEFNSMWGCVFSVCAALEMALNRGELITRECEVKVPNVNRINNLDDLFREFESCAKYLLDICVGAYLEQARISEATRPDCFVSLLTDGCIEKRCDRISGARYHNVSVECMGMINAADGIFAIDKLVFDAKKYTLDEINAAIKAGFKGYESLRRDILSCSKFGQNSEADGYAARVAEMLQRVIREYDRGNMYFSPTLHTLDKNVSYGSAWGATYDGRLAGEPFAKNAGASNHARKSDPTSLVLSAAKLPQHKFYGGQPIDVSFDPDTVKNHKKEIAALISTYLLNGGLQFQVNALSSETLREAMESPEKYPDLIVRIGGYSVYFGNLLRATQEEFVERFEREGH